MAEPEAGYSKVCIGQTSITDDLRCLPVFLAGCNGILVTTGHTYPTRQWGALELFVYFAMATEDPLRALPTILLLSSDAFSPARIRTSWLCFDVQGCNCCNPDDKQRVLNVVEQFPGSILGFYGYIRGLATSALRDALRSNGEAELVDPIVIGAGIMEEDLRLGVVLHQWSERGWERVASARAAL